MTELKPCPFCGSKDVDVRTHKSLFVTNTYGIICLDCGIQTGQSYTNKLAAIRVWNRRVKDAAD